MLSTVIVSSGRYVPSRLVTNKDLERMMDTSDQWIRERTGIEQRYWIPEEGGVGASDLGLEAARIAIHRAGWKPEDIDLILFATLSPDIFFPGAGCLLQHKLGLTTTPAMDIRNQCTGFLYALATADAFIRSGEMERILIVGAEVHSTGLDISTRGRTVAVLFGDGAAAVCVEKRETPHRIGVLATVLRAQGEFADALKIEAPASRMNPRLTVEMLERGDHYPYMDGQTVFKHAVRRLSEVAQEVLNKAGVTINDIDLIIPHQANYRINQMVGEILKCPEKVFHNIQRYGNTTAASIPLAWDEALEMGKIRSGSLVLFLAFGSGFTWGGSVYQVP